MSSRGIPLTAINGGMNRLRVKGAARKDTLYQLTNAYVTAGNTIKPRGGTIRNADLSLTAGAGTTKGLVAHQGALHTFSAQKVAVPAGYVDHVLSHPAATQFIPAPNLVPSSAVSSLIHFEDGDGSTTFTDSAASPHTWTTHGTAVESTAQAKFGSGSGFFPTGGPTTNWLSTVIQPGDSLDLSIGNWTIECFVYLTAWSSYASTIYNGTDGGGNNSGPRIHVISTGALEVNYVSNSMTSTGGLISLNAWHHVAVVQDGGQIKAYVDGALIMQRDRGPSSWAAVSANHQIWIGGSSGIYNALGGYMDEFRVTKGFALYGGATYTVPTAALDTNPSIAYLLGTLLHFDDGTNTFVDSSLAHNVWTAGGTNGTCTESTAQKKFGTGALFSSGTNAFISTPQNAGSPLDLAATTNDFTAEYWVYPTTLSQAATATHLDFSASSTTLFKMLMADGGGVRFQPQAPFSQLNTVTHLTVNAWNHVALVKAGNTTWLFLNGNLEATGDTGNNNLTAWPALPGSGNVAFLAAAYNSGSTASGLSNGYLDEVIVTVGLAKYDRNFTPPVAPSVDGLVTPIPLKEIHFAAPFMGFLYVVAEFTTDAGSGLGTVFHYWLQTSGKWLANTLYQVGQIISPNVDNGLTYRAERFGAPNPAWATSTLKAMNDKVEPTVPNGFLYTATVVDGGNPITGTTEPTWPIVDGGVVYEESEKTGTGEVATPAPQPALTTPSPGTGGRYINPYRTTVIG